MCFSSWNEEPTNKKHKSSVRDSETIKRKELKSKSHKFTYKWRNFLQHPMIHLSLILFYENHEGNQIKSLPLLNQLKKRVECIIRRYFHRRPQHFICWDFSKIIMQTNWIINSVVPVIIRYLPANVPVSVLSFTWLSWVNGVPEMHEKWATQYFGNCFILRNIFSKFGQKATRKVLLF